MPDKKEPKVLSEKEQRIARIRKRRKTIVFAGSAAILGIILLTVIFAVLFRVRSFRITYKNDVPYTQKEITSALSEFADKNLFSVSTEDVAPVLESELPYIGSVTVLRKLPGTLSVTVSKSKEVYAVELNEGMYAITDGNLKVLKIDNAVPSGAALVQGRKSSDGYELGKELSFSSELGDDEIRTALKDIAAEAKSSGLKNISLIDINSEDGIYMIYDGRIIVRLGNVSNIRSKIALAKKSIDEENEISPKGYGELNVTISKKAVFAPKDYKDIEELALYEEKINPSEAPGAEDEESTETDGSEETTAENTEETTEETSENTENG